MFKINHLSQRLCIFYTFFLSIHSHRPSRFQKKNNNSAIYTIHSITLMLSPPSIQKHKHTQLRNDRRVCDDDDHHHRCRTSQSPCSRECVQQFCFRYVCQPPLNAPQHNTRQKSEKQTAVICNEIPPRKFCRLNTIFSERYFPDFIPLKLDIHLRNQTPVSLFVLLQHRKAVYLTH